MALLNAMQAAQAMERVKIHRAQEITGLDIRCLQLMAARGEIPGAAKLGSLWTFDELTLRRWIKVREKASCLKTSTNGAKLGGGEFNLEDANTARAYTQLIARKRTGGSGRGARK